MDEKRFAILIDADNISAKYIKNILDETSNYGTVTYKRIYADWTQPTTSSWKKILLENSIIPIQQYSYTTGKNSTDSALIIDAMDILYSNTVEGFSIVSSDSDFTRLAMRLRESGKMVIGMGEQKTPKPFVSSCNQFKFLDIISEEDDNNDSSIAETQSISTFESNSTSYKDESLTNIETIKKEIINIISDIQESESGVNIGEVGQKLIKRYPDFDVRNYGYSKLSRFLAEIDSLIVNLSVVTLKTEDVNNDVQSLQISSNIKSEILNIINDNNGKVQMSIVHQKLLEKYPNYIKKYGYNKAIKFFKSLNFLNVKQTKTSIFLTIKNNTSKNK
ncbi:MAG: NYN domain-containing protein [Clostridium butyricum]|nr:NYN domain-containing protein [Clostridium butyricum]